MRPLASDASIASGFIDLMRYNGWRHFAIITQEEELFTLVSEPIRMCCLHVVVSTLICFGIIISTFESTVNMAMRSCVSDSIVTLCTFVSMPNNV